MSFQTWYERSRKRWENFITLRKREFFFGFVATFALAQIFRREYEMRQRKAVLDANTPQRQHRIQLIESVKASENPYGLKTEWKR